MFPLSSLSSKISEWGAVLISVLVLVVFLVMVAVAYFAHDNNSLSLLSGASVAMATGIVQYWTGSSRGSANKDQIIASMTPPAAPVPAPVVPVAAAAPATPAAPIA
jgi:hypothetical protein